MKLIFSDKIKPIGGKSADELRKSYLALARTNSALTTEAGAKAYFSGKKSEKKEAAASVKDEELKKNIKSFSTEEDAKYEANLDIRKVKIKELRASRKIEKLKEEIALIEESIKQMKIAKDSASAAKAYLEK